MRRQSNDMPSIPAEFLEYLNSVEKFCPFLAPSRDRNLCKISVYAISENNSEELSARIFCAALIHTELFRKNRIINEKFSHLHTENLIFTPPPELDKQMEQLVAWPHWCLKLLYTKKSILFGKFWNGEKKISQASELLPIPPATFISIRSAIRNLDLRFFSKAETLKPQFQAAEDDGRYPTIDEGVISQDVWDRALHLAAFDDPNTDSLVTAAEYLYTKNAYKDAVAWAKTK